MTTQPEHEDQAVESQDRDVHASDEGEGSEEVSARDLTAEDAANSEESAT